MLSTEFVRALARSRRSALGVGVTVCWLACSSRAASAPSPAQSANDQTWDVMVGANGNSRIQFIVIREEPVIVPPGGNCWGPQPAVGDPNCAFGVNETQSRVMLVFFDAKGRETGKFKFPTNPLNTTASNIGNVPVLIATQEFANLPGAPTPNFIMPPLLNPIAGKVCFTNNPANLRAFVRN